MHPSAFIISFLVAFTGLMPVFAIPTNVVDSNVGTGPVGVGNVGGGNAQGSNFAGSNLGALAVGAATGKLNRLESQRVRRAPKKTKEQPQYINSPQASNEGSCNVGTAQCCQSLHQTQELASQGVVGSLLAAGVPLDNLMVGVQCTPIAGLVPVLSGSDSCKSQPVCCTGNKFDGLISTGCSPIGLN